MPAKRSKGGMFSTSNKGNIFCVSRKVAPYAAFAFDSVSFPVLLQTLRKLTSSKDIILNVTYNPKLLGGIIIEYNSTSIDASILKEFSLFFAE